MSDLYRSALHGRISKLPPMPPADLEEGNEEEEAADSIGSLPSMGPPKTRRAGSKREPNPQYSPISGSGFFEQAFQVAVPESNLEVRVYYTPPKFADGTVMVCHHGAGWSALTFAPFAKEIASMSKGECGVLAFDCRAHGKTTSTAPSREGPENLSIETLTADCVNILANVFADVAAAPTLLLVGHSLGGSVIVRACPLLQERKFRITGVAVIDVVEEFTLEALPMMNSLLDTRPDGFGSPEEAIEWHIRTNAIRNVDSARVAVPGIIMENPSPSATSQPWVWRTPLRDTAPYWTSWFTGLSGKFLAARTARILVLAGAERLDKELMIGQMQGKFQLVVLAGVGHMVHTDDPERLAEVLFEFQQRNEHVVVGVKKVGEL